MPQIIFDRKAKSLYVEDQLTKDILASSHFGNMEKGILFLRPEEVLYLMDVRKGQCTDTEGATVKFNEIAAPFNSKKFMARYFTYKDWRDRGLIARYESDARIKGPRTQYTKRYNASTIKLKAHRFDGAFFPADMVTVVDDPEKGKAIYDEMWFGQYGTYKLADHGTLNKLDIYETLFLIDRGVLNTTNSTRKQIPRYCNRQAARFPKAL